MNNLNRLQIIARGEDKLVAELKNHINSGHNIYKAIQNGIGIDSVKSVVNDFSQANRFPQVEAVVLPFLRPVLFIKHGEIEIPESDELKERLFKYKPMIERGIGSVGRIELKNHQEKNVGTGWLISDRIIATNRHVAEKFATKKSRTAFGGLFKKNFLGDDLKAVVDFKEEYHLDSTINNQFEIEIERILYLPDSSQSSPDIALLKIKNSHNLPEPIPFVENKLHVDQLIGVVGYPFQDPRGVEDREMEKRIFGDVFGVKRYAPGQIIEVQSQPWYFLHDASTLGGNSGSLIHDMETGCAIGIHFGGILLEGNYAVKGKELLDASSKLGLRNMFSFQKERTDLLVHDLDMVIEKPFRVEDYSNRKGFEEKFLENETGKIKVILPKIKSKEDILKFGENNEESELKYTHFSVQMSKTRRMCYYSAVNIDGQNYKRIKRTGWRYDPRIDQHYQIMKECYGNYPKFSRGHMTRREDPNWGTLAAQANEDTMHVTNACPQMQFFNAGEWLKLENYALENAKRDKQKICVFTGPFFSDSDPKDKFSDVQIPKEYWKIIVFVHDETEKLCATGYTQSQEDFIERREFVYGSFMTYQVPIRLIEKKSKISFGELSDLDPLKDNIFESIYSPIQSLRQIRFY